MKYADLQMAAEAFFSVNKTGDLISSGFGLIDALKAGNVVDVNYLDRSATTILAGGSGE
ncbi:hypothetical protein [Polaromonas sp.]|uniref:hypothetical protein n=1 Tax=Polaromonas sp. TaxID=1869339 RepID=UPI0025E95C40|nr:hypothetical protein [Polaromonas sp.]